MGTVCVMDRVPRELDPAMREALQMLARQVVALLDMRRAVARLRKTTDELLERRPRNIFDYDQSIMSKCRLVELL